MPFILKKKNETENKTIRFPKPLIEQINAVAGSDTSFSSFVLQACEYALAHMDDDAVTTRLPDLTIPTDKKTR
jgi:hypothetical protein